MSTQTRWKDVWACWLARDRLWKIMRFMISREMTYSQWVASQNKSQWWAIGQFSESSTIGLVTQSKKFGLNVLLKKDHRQSLLFRNVEWTPLVCNSELLMFFNWSFRIFMPKIGLLIAPEVSGPSSLPQEDYIINSREEKRIFWGRVILHSTCAHSEDWKKGGFVSLPHPTMKILFIKKIVFWVQSWFVTGIRFLRETWYYLGN